MQTRFGRLKGRLAVPPRPMRLAELAYSFLALDERLIGMAVASEVKQGKAVSCQKGCSICCNQAVPISPAEAWMLADLVRSFPPERKARVLQRFARSNQRLREEGYGVRYEDPTASMEEINELGLAYFKLGLPCPFLEDHACSIHPHRPTACREYLVTSPAANCADPGNLRVDGVPLAVSLTECLSELSAQVMGGEPQVIPMTLALDWAEAHHELGRQRYDSATLMTAFIGLMGSTEG